MNKEAEISKELIKALEEKIQLLEEQKVISQNIINIQKEQLTLTGVVVSLPKFKNGQTLKRVSKYTDDFTEITIASIENTKKGYRYTSTNNVWFYEEELLAY